MHFIIVPSSEEYINCPIPPPVHSAIPINSMMENILKNLQASFEQIED